MATLETILEAYNSTICCQFSKSVLSTMPIKDLVLNPDIGLTFTGGYNSFKINLEGTLIPDFETSKKSTSKSNWVVIGACKLTRSKIIYYTNKLEDVITPLAIFVSLKDSENKRLNAIRQFWKKPSTDVDFENLLKEYVQNGGSANIVYLDIFAYKKYRTGLQLK